MSNIYTFGTNTFGMGDVLLLTSVFKHLPKNYVVQLAQSQARFKLFFDNICEVQFTNYITPIPDLPQSKLHASTQRLKFFFKEDAPYMDNRPLVLHFNSKNNQRATEILSKHKKPIIFSPFSSKNGAKHRNLPPALISSIINQLKKQNYNVILTGMSDNFCEIEGVDEQLVDLDLSLYTHILRNCKEYIGCNTGDMHLAIAVGCKTTAYHPKNDKQNPLFKEHWVYNHPTIKNLYFKS